MFGCVSRFEFLELVHTEFKIIRLRILKCLYKLIVRYFLEFVIKICDHNL